jgi:hypothetical protein
VETWPEGARYEGEYYLSKKQGRGKYTWVDGSTYEGDWLDNKINGIGTYLWRDGRQYYGQWKNNDMHGTGIYCYADGIQYWGQYADDKKEGYGLYLWVDGREYAGYWHNGKQHGLGIFTDPKKGTKRHGLWEFGKRIKWYEDSDVALINQRKFDYLQDFSDPEAKKYSKASFTFEKPAGLTKELEKLKKTLNV